MGDTWHLDKLFVKIQGQRQYLWRAVDQDGDVIDIFVQPHPDQPAAQRFFRKLLKGQEREPWRLVTDKLRSYEAAHRAIKPSVEHDTERWAVSWLPPHTSTLPRFIEHQPVVPQRLTDGTAVFSEVFAEHELYTLPGTAKSYVEPLGFDSVLLFEADFLQDLDE